MDIIQQLADLPVKLGQKFLLVLFFPSFDDPKGEGKALQKVISAIDGSDPHGHQIH